MNDFDLGTELERFLQGSWTGARRIQGIQGGATAYVLALVAERSRRRFSSSRRPRATLKISTTIWDFSWEKSAPCRRFASGSIFFHPGKSSLSRNYRRIRTMWRDVSKGSTNSWRSTRPYL